MSKYLDFEGNIIDNKSKSQNDFIKLNLLIPSGAVFGHQKYGYIYLDLSDLNSVKDSVNRSINLLSSGSELTIKSVNVVNNSINVELKNA